MKQKYKLIRGDCFEQMYYIPDNTIDAVITDPPYFRTKNNWDVFANNEEYLKFTIGWIKECERILKPNKPLLFFHNHIPYIAKIINILENENFKFRSFLTWHKPNFQARSWTNLSQNSTLRSWFNSCEYILHYESCGNLKSSLTGLQQIHSDKNLFRPIKDYLLNEKRKIEKSLNITHAEFIKYISDITNTKAMYKHWFTDSQFEIPTKARYEMLQKSGFFLKKYEDLRAEYEDLRAEYEDLRTPFNKTGKNYNNVITEPIVNPVTKNRHPTQKPIQLIEYLIETITNENDIILDPFVGSGTTILAGLNLNRKVIGIEKSPEYHLIAQGRINETII